MNTNLLADYVKRSIVQLGSRLENLRRQHDMSQMEVVDALLKLGVNYTQSHISKVEAGRTAAQADLLIGLMRIYNVTPNEMWGVQSGSGRSQEADLIARMIDGLDEPDRRKYVSLLSGLLEQDRANREVLEARYRELLRLVEQAGGPEARERALRLAGLTETGEVLEPVTQFLS
jgi:transcriptional regulator with XRE-family HTH domain